MATFIMDPNGQKIYQKLYQDKNYMQNEFLILKRTPKQIANDNNVSYKLINTWLIKHNLVPDNGKLVTV